MPRKKRRSLSPKKEEDKRKRLEAAAVKLAEESELLTSVARWSAEAVGSELVDRRRYLYEKGIGGTHDFVAMP